ncbi:MAG: hypothetical protein AWU58_737 [Methanohalophilus sp. T328-1]|nr:MAG: hypothetical protein AWU58_737 [Methanohalophilus sp. T328-1]
MNSKTILIAVVALFLALSVIGLMFGEDAPEETEPAEPTAMEQSFMTYMDQEGIGYGEVEVDGTVASVYVDPTTLTYNDLYNVTYTFTDRMINSQDSVHVTVFVYDSQSYQQLAEGGYDMDSGRIVIE